ncbi:hypothetical protein [Streptomyces sp. NBC_01789]|uniref:hypothetical protein n=1 Tax=Streptomyces sp. NBC_01789 TaxID=2975941 RepID=UPI0022547316|nr:hypothetical protein [Streptomyces sp. NBC_01789]MCX4451641.1 hypothetical protein [Streptomyces sp. NBC_01789]
MTDLNLPGAAPESRPGGTGRMAAGTGRVGFSLARWVLDPRTTWHARRLAADEGMDAQTAWVTARLARHPDEHVYALPRLDDDRRPAN